MILREFFGPRANIPNVDEEFLLTESLRTAVGPENYPGDGATSPNWPGLGPGASGVLNAMSGKYYDASGMVQQTRELLTAYAGAGGRTRRSRSRRQRTACRSRFPSVSPRRSRRG